MNLVPWRSHRHGIPDRIVRAAEEYMAAKAANFGPDLMRVIEKSILLQLFDAVWKEHLLALDHLRQGIVLRAYGQRDPLNEYKSEAYRAFAELMGQLREDVGEERPVIIEPVERRVRVDDVGSHLGRPAPQIGLDPAEVAQQQRPRLEETAGARMVLPGKVGRRRTRAGRDGHRTAPAAPGS